ncbi:MAG: MFS transporter [Gammaproteobacteria bacterium]|nr:MFS transporter [Gammaproteobacteria bacterium]
MSHFQNRFNLLKRPSFFAYSIGFFFAAIGNGLGYIAMSWIVVNRHSDVTAMAILLACFWGPNIILGPFMGVLADRLSRKLIIIVSNFVRACIFIFFSFYLKEHFSVNMIYLMMLCIGTAFSAFFSTAMAFMRELVPQEDLIHANSTIDVLYEMGNLIGMGGAGLLIAWTSSETAIFINGITFLIATVTMLVIPKRALQHGEKQSKQKIKLMKDFKEGLLYLLRKKELMAIYTIQLLIFITYLTSPLLLVPFSKTILHATVKQFGMIEACASIGIVFGGILMPWIAERFGLMRTLLFFTSMLCVTFLLFGYNRSITLAELMYFIIGLAGAVWPLIISKAQSLTANNFQGRVQSTFNSLSGIMMLLFYFSIATIGKHFGVNHLYFLEVGVTVLAIVFLIQARKQF